MNDDDDNDDDKWPIVYAHWMVTFVLLISSQSQFKKEEKTSIRVTQSIDWKIHFSFGKDGHTVFRTQQF